MLIALGFYNSRIAIVTLICLAALVGLALFYNVRAFVVWILPLVFLVADNRFYAVILMIILAGLLAERLSSHKMTLDFPYVLWVGLLLAAGLNGMFRGVDRGGAQYFFVFSLAFPILLFLLIYNLNLSLQQIRTFLFVVSIVVAVLGFISLAQYFATHIGRVIFRWDSQNPAACVFGMIIPFSLISMLDCESRDERIGMGIILLGVMAALFVTQTRAVLVSSLVGVTYIAMADRRVLKVMLPGLLLAGVAAPGLIVYRIAMFLGHGDTPDWSAVGRIDIWMNSLKFIPKYFWFGMGLDSFRHLYPANFPLAFQPKAEHPHNIFLRWLFDYGFFGLVAYTVLIALILWVGLRVAKQTSETTDAKGKRLLLAINAGIISALIANLFDSTMANALVANLFWLFLAILLTSSRHLSLLNRKTEGFLSPVAISTGPSR